MSDDLDALYAERQALVRRALGEGQPLPLSCALPFDDALRLHEVERLIEIAEAREAIAKLDDLIRSLERQREDQRETLRELGADLSESVVG